VVYSQIIGERYAVSVRGKLIAHFKTASTYPVLQYLLFLWFDFLSLFRPLNGLIFGLKATVPALIAGSGLVTLVALSICLYLLIGK